MGADKGTGVIVVGIDGSTESKAALRWALEEAALRGATVHVVHAWTFPTFAASTFGPLSVSAAWLDDFEKSAHHVLESTIAEIAPAYPAVPLTADVEQGHPADVLLRATKDVDLVVVGSRGLGGFSGMLLGSVSTQVAHHAHCPVVIVPSS